MILNLTDHVIFDGENLRFELLEGPVCFIVLGVSFLAVEHYRVFQRTQLSCIGFLRLLSSWRSHASEDPRLLYDLKLFDQTLNLKFVIISLNLNILDPLSAFLTGLNLRLANFV